MDEDFWIIYRIANNYVFKHFLLIGFHRNLIKVKLTFD